MAGIDEYFDNLRGDGTLDSSGVFTLDPKKVEWKLAQYRLASPKLYPLFLLKAACLVEVPSLGLEYNKGFLSSKVGVEITIPELEVSEVELKQTTLAQSGSPQEVLYLVVALTAARALGTVEVLSPGLHLTATGEKLAFRPPQKAVVGTHFRLSGEMLDDPAEILRERGRWSPVPLSCLQPEKRKSIVDADCPNGTLAVLTGPDYSDGLKSTYRWGTFRSEDPALVMLAWTKSTKSTSLGIYRGVSYELDLNLPDAFQIVIRCDDLDLDLSYSNFVQNEAFEEKKKQALEFVSTLVETVVNSEPTLTIEEVEEMTTLIKACWREGSCPEGLKLFYETAVFDHFPLQPQGWESMYERLTGFELDHQVELFLRRYRREIIETRAFYVPTSKQWIKEEIEFRQAVGHDTQEADTVKRLLEYLFFKKNVSWNKWKIHPFLSHLESYLEMDNIPSDGLDSLDGVHPSWFEPLNSCDKLSGSGFAPFRFLGLLESGQFGKASSIVEQSSASSIAPFRHIWFQLMLDFSRGQLSWLQSIKLRAKASFAREAEQRLVKRTRTMEAAGVFEDWALYHGIFDEGFWFLAIYYTCLQRKLGRPAHKFWCKVLLQAAIGYPGEDGTIEENLSRPLRLPLRSRR